MKAGSLQSRRDLLGSAALLILVCWLCFNWLSTLNHILRYYNPLPVSDYWRVIEDLPAMQAGHWSWLWRQHNEHRIVFPEVVFAADELLFSGRQILPLIASFACYLSTVTLLGCTFWRSAEAPTPVKIRALLLSGIIVGWPLSAFVLGAPFLLQWTLLQFAVVLGLLTVTSSRPSVPVCVACGVVATFSSANGILLWPVLLGIAVYRRVSRGRVIWLALCAVAAVGVFFIGYERPSTALSTSLHHPASPVGFVLSYLSMPFGVLRHPAFGFTFGLLNLAVWLGCFASSFRRSRSLSRYEAIAFGYFLFLILTATLTSIGRINPGDLGFSNAKAARYVTLPLLGWALSVPLVCSVSLREKWRFLPVRTILLLTAAIIGFMQIRLGRWLRTNDDYVSHQQWAAVSLENGIFDPANVGSVFPEQAFVQHYLPVLKAYRKSIFADPAFPFIGQNFRAVFPEASRRTEAGGSLRTTRVPGGVSIVGWAAHLGGSGATMVLVNEAGEIVGLGRHLRAGIPRELSPLAVKESSTWVGYVNEHYPSKSFTPYRIARNHLSASPIGPETNFRDRAR